MPAYCVAFGCSHNNESHFHVQFHSFPDRVKDEERFLKWVHVIKRKNFVPSKWSKLCSAHFLATDYEPLVNQCATLRRLKKDAVPSIFDFSEHLLPKKVKERRPLIRLVPDDMQQENVQTSVAITEPASRTVEVQTTLTGIELTETIAGLRHDKRILQNQVSRLNRRLQDAKDTIQLLKGNTVLDSIAKGITGSNFQSSLPFELYENEIGNAEKAPGSRHYSDEIKQFCSTLHFYSPKAYDFLRHRSILPAPSTIRRWISTGECKILYPTAHKANVQHTANSELLDTK